MSLTCGDTCGDRDVCDPADDAHGTSDRVPVHKKTDRVLQVLRPQMHEVLHAWILDH